MWSFAESLAERRLSAEDETESEPVEMEEENLFE